MSRTTRAFIDWVVVVGIALLVAILVRTFLLAHFVVDGTSMATTLHTGDRVFVNKLSYRLHDPNRGDVVVLHQIGGSAERDLIKRVIALPGETIEIRSCQVTIDGKLLEEPYLDPDGGDPGQLWWRLRTDVGPRRLGVRDGRQPPGFVRQPRPRPDPRVRPRRPRVRRVLARAATGSGYRDRQAPAL